MTQKIVTPPRSERHLWDTSVVQGHTMRTCVARVTFAVTVLIGSVLPGPTFSQTAPLQKICEDSNADPYQRISACSALIQTQRFPDGKPIPPKVLAWQYVNRGIAYEAISDFSRAIADQEKALPYFPNNKTNIHRLKILAQWPLYLKEIQDEGDYPNWAGPPLDSYWSTR